MTNSDLGITQAINPDVARCKTLFVIHLAVL